MKRHSLILLALLLSTVPLHAQQTPQMRFQLKAPVLFSAGTTEPGGELPPGGGTSNPAAVITWTARSARSFSDLSLAVGVQNVPAAAVDVEGLPSGLTFDPVTGAIVGQTSFVGTSPLTFKVANETILQGNLTTLHPLFATVDIPQIYAEEPFSFTPSAVAPGLYGTASWDREGFPLDLDGLSFDTATGQVSGTLASSGTYPGLRLGLTDSQDSLRVTTDAFVLDVLPALQPVATIAASFTGYTGRPFVATPSATSVKAPAAWSTSAGTLPSWATRSPTTGEITGTPNAVATTGGLTLRVTGANGKFDDTDPFGIQILSPYTISLPTNGLVWRQTIPRTLQLTSSATSPVYSKVGGASWLAVSSTGAVSGNPPSGTHSLVVRATQDGWAEQSFNISVVPNIAYTTLPGNVSIVSGATAKTTAVPALSGTPVNPVYTVVDASGQPITLPAWITKAANGQLTVAPGAGTTAQTLYYRLRATDDTGGDVTSSEFTITVTDPPPTQQFDQLRVIGTNAYNRDAFVLGAGNCWQLATCAEVIQVYRSSQYNQTNDLEVRLNGSVLQTPTSLKIFLRGTIGSVKVRLEDGNAANNTQTSHVVPNATSQSITIPVGRPINKIVMTCGGIDCQYLPIGMQLIY